MAVQLRPTHHGITGQEPGPESPPSQAFESLRDFWRTVTSQWPGIPRLPAPVIIPREHNWKTMLIKIVLISLLVGAVPVLSKKLQKFKHSFSDVCRPKHLESIRQNMSVTLQQQTNHSMALELVNITEMDLSTLNYTLTNSQYSCAKERGSACVITDPADFRSYPGWPNGCSTEMAEKALDAAKSQTCEEKHCKKVLWVIQVACITVSIPCPAPTAFQQEAALASYTKQQALQERPPPTVEMYAPDNVQQSSGWKIAVESLLSVVDLATLVYSAYLAASIWFGAPFRFHRGRWHASRWGGVILGLSEYMFIIVFVVVWYVYHWINKYHVSFFDALWSSSITAPCLVSPEVANITANETVAVCNDVGHAYNNFTKNVHDIKSVDMSADAYRACYSACWECQENFNPELRYATTEVAATFAEIMGKPQYNNTYVFPASCNLTELRKYVAEHIKDWAESTGVNGVTAMFKGGILSALLIKFAICRLIFSFFVVFLDPLVAHSQGVEKFGEGSEQEDVREAERYLRFWRFWPFLVEFAVVVLMCLNLSQSHAFWKD